MQYEFLAKWVKENPIDNLIVQSIQRFEDQYVINFLRRKERLQICLADESFCFFTTRRDLSFTSRKELHLFDQKLADARLQELHISDDDRIIFCKFGLIDVFNQHQEYTLILELIPRYQNIILIQNNLIVDCLKKVSFAENTQRQILPGLIYSPPPSGFKVVKKAVVYPLKINEKLKLIPAESGGFERINAAFEALYYDGFLIKRKEQLIQKQAAILHKQIDQKQRKLEKLEAELASTSQESEWLQKAELLKANLHLIKTGMKQIAVKNYFQDDFPEIEIALDETKTPRQNMDNFFKKYRKARDGKNKISQQIEITANEIDKLQKQLDQQGTNVFLSEKNNSQQLAESVPTENYKKLKVDENWEIYIGRTSRENDFLTTKLAKPHDWWFHTRIFRGTHVILRNLRKNELPENLKLLCCRLAAYYSKAKKSGNVPVDFTEIRYVRKPRGAVPGYVTYTNQKTLYVDPISLRAAKEQLN
ncbi:MAG TPA: NFACT RNA binding domain-containing protein [Candidatus Cloacimonadota bacterium]|nr:NFACT RNA binding domain-containing protein [Candidatus Cloacimonadota bacterium]